MYRGVTGIIIYNSAGSVAPVSVNIDNNRRDCSRYNPFLVYCRELAPGAVSLTGDRAQGDDSKHDLHYSIHITMFTLSGIMQTQI